MKVTAQSLIAECEKSLTAQFEQQEAIALINQKRIMSAFAEYRVSPQCFDGQTGYGIDDLGRDIFDRVFARAVQAESAAVRLQLVSGTHALAAALLGNLKPGERMLSLTGRPYDTMEAVIGLAGNEPGSLKDLGVAYEELDFCEGNLEDKELLAKLQSALKPPTRVAYIQKSCGYSFARRSLTCAEIGKLITVVRHISPQCLIMVDNCYGEFVEDKEPTALGADIIAGSLIKNPGGGLAVSGGYVAGTKSCVERALNRITAPGVGGKIGLHYFQNRLLYQGLFLAPAVVLNAVKGALLFAEAFDRLGFTVNPHAQCRRGDIIQAVKFGNLEKLAAFLQNLQKSSPIDAHVIPEPANMPGYTDQVIMAGGTFVEGSTIELSADGPLRPPYAAFIQGGLSYLHIKCALENILQEGFREYLCA